MTKYVDTVRMAALLSIIEKNINEIKTAIDNYSAKAPSLGESSFLPTVEGNLIKIKNLYVESFNPSLDEIIKNINSVKEEYDLRSTNIDNPSILNTNFKKIK